MGKRVPVTTKGSTTTSDRVSVASRPAITPIAEPAALQPLIFAPRRVDQAAIVNTVLRSTQPEWVWGKGSTSHCGWLDFQRPSPREVYRVGLVLEVVAPGGTMDSHKIESLEVIVDNAQGLNVERTIALRPFPAVKLPPDVWDYPKP
jgi:hypothetical protein